MPAMFQTPFEAGRIFAASYAGKKARLCLATSTVEDLDSTTAQWDAVEKSGNGYARCEWTIPEGDYSSGAGRFEAETQNCQFAASSGGAGLTWNSVYLVIGTIGGGGVVTWNTGVSFALTENPVVTLAAGTSRPYTVKLFTDGFTVTA